MSPIQVDDMTFHDVIKLYAKIRRLQIREEDVKDIMRNRDSLLRELTYSDKPNAPLVAQLLRDSISDSAGLETSVYNAFNSLGFETTQIGGNGKPDGLATAYIGPKDSAINYAYDLTWAEANDYTWSDLSETQWKETTA